MKFLKNVIIDQNFTTMGRVLAKSEPLGEKELSFLRAHILKQRRKTQKGFNLMHVPCHIIHFHLVEVRKLVAFTKERKDHDEVLSDATRESCNKEDTPEHIGKQVNALELFKACIAV